MNECDDMPARAGAQDGDEEQLGPVARVIVGALALPVAGLMAAGVLLLVGLSLAVAALVLLLGLLAGAATVPLARLAGRRPPGRPFGFSRRRVIDAEATVREVDSTPRAEHASDEE